MEVKLTQYSHGAGCGCKIAPAVLDKILHSNFVQQPDAQLLVGYETKDDAAVYDLGMGKALISTTDFFSPIVDDAYDFGRIAATNAISDVYAMGGKPILAIAILGWPVDKLPTELAQQVLDGARKVCADAGIVLAGGHSIDAPEPFFGLAVNGLVDIAHLKRNNSVQNGDKLYITKPLGVGILATAEKRAALLPEHKGLATAYMCKSNSIGYELAQLPGVHAMTDVTGFGLAGHLLEMLEGSGLSAVLDQAVIPVLPEALHYAGLNILPDATFRNWNSYSKQIIAAKGTNEMQTFCLLPDPQTSGGLLIAVAPEAVEGFEACLRKNGIDESLIVAFGQIEEQGGQSAIYIK